MLRCAVFVAFLVAAAAVSEEAQRALDQVAQDQKTRLRIKMKSIKDLRSMLTELNVPFDEDIDKKDLRQPVFDNAEARTRSYASVTARML